MKPPAVLGGDMEGYDISHLRSSTVLTNGYAEKETAPHETVGGYAVAVSGGKESYDVTQYSTD